MEDVFGREINYLRISVTDFCNLRCSYCMPETGVPKKEHSEILSIEEIERIVLAAAELGIDKVRITGGEPLVRKGILEICRRIGSIKGLREVCITTNGVLLGDMAMQLKEAGVTRVNVSLDTLDPQKFKKNTRCGNLSDVLRGIEAAVAAKLFPLKINVVLIGGFNEDEIPDFVALTQHSEIDVRFIELMPIGESASWDSNCFIPGSRVLELVPELVPVEGGRGVARLFRVPGYLGSVGLINPMSRHFCNDCNRIRVTADGKLKTCLHSDEEIDLKNLSDVELKEQLSYGIISKPSQHHLNEWSKSQSSRNMFQIGG